MSSMDAPFILAAVNDRGRLFPQQGGDSGVAAGALGRTRTVSAGRRCAALGTVRSSRGTLKPAPGCKRGRRGCACR